MSQARDAVRKHWEHSDGTEIKCREAALPSPKPEGLDRDEELDRAPKRVFLLVSPAFNSFISQKHLSILES